MIHLDDELVRRHLPWPELIDALAQMFRTGCTVAPRVHHDIPVTDAPDATLLLMPAWQSGQYIGVKLVTVFPGNAAVGLASVAATYLMFDGRRGQPVACLDASRLTARRTAAASALAARYLSRHDATRLLIVGTGRVARELASAHAVVRGLRQVQVWGRDPDKAARLAGELQAEGLPASAAIDLRAACADADIISCATLATEPLLRREWIAPGTHIDLVGAFKPSMREADASLIQRAEVFVDTRVGALTEAGDLMQAMALGCFTADDIRADLAELARQDHPGRRRPDAITVFKSVGTASEDLAAAALVLQRHAAAAAAPEVPRRVAVVS